MSPRGHLVISRQKEVEPDWRRAGWGDGIPKTLRAHFVAMTLALHKRRLAAHQTSVENNLLESLAFNARMFVHAERTLSDRQGPNTPHTTCLDARAPTHS